MRTITARPATAARIAADQRQAVGDLQIAEIAGTDPAAGLEASASLDEYTSAMVSANQDLQKLYAAVGYLRAIDGEKHKVYVTEEGISLPRGDDDESLAAVASGARMVIDIIKTGGASAPIDLGLGARAGRGNAGRGAAISR